MSRSMGAPQTPSHGAKPLLHPHPQVPAVQVRVLLAGPDGHSVAAQQPPMATHDVGQALRFPLQVKPQVPEVHVAVALAGGVQSLGPQHCPIAMQPVPHAWYVPVQVKPQVPAGEQVATPFGGEVQSALVQQEALARQAPPHGR